MVRILICVLAFASIALASISSFAAAPGPEASMTGISLPNAAPGGLSRSLVTPFGQSTPPRAKGLIKAVAIMAGTREKGSSDRMMAAFKQGDERQSAGRVPASK